MIKKPIGICVCIMLFIISCFSVTGISENENYITEPNSLPWFRFGHVVGEYDNIVVRDGFFRDIALESEGGNIHFKGYAIHTWEYHEIDNANFLFTPWFFGYCFNGKIRGYCISFGDHPIDVDLYN
jgi:hypothetical protein